MVFSASTTVLADSTIRLTTSRRASVENSFIPSANQPNRSMAATLIAGTALVAPVFALGPLRHPPPAMQQGRFPYRYGGPGYEPRGPWGGYGGFGVGFGGTPQQSTAQAAEMARQRAEAARVAEKAASEAARLAQEEADAIAELVKAEEAAAKARRDEVEALQQAAVAARERAEAASARAVPPGPMPVGPPPGIDPFPYPVRMSSFGPPVRRAPARAQRTRGGRRQAPHSTRDGTGEASAPSTSSQGAASVRREALTRNQAAFHGR